MGQKLLSSILLGLLVSGATVLPSPSEIDGIWNTTFEAGWGSTEMQLDLTRQGDRLRGFAAWGPQRVLVEQGEIDGSDVHFVIVAGDGVTHTIDLVFRGRWEGDRMQGTVAGEKPTGGVEGWPAEGHTWTARRAAP